MPRREPVTCALHQRISCPCGVSSLYRLAPSETSYATKDEAERRLKAMVRRLVVAHGPDVVLRRIREWPDKTKEDEARKAWLVLTVYQVEPRKSGTM